MRPKTNFLDRVVSRLDRLDRASVQNYVSNLIHDNTLAEQILDEINEGIVLLNSEGIVKQANRCSFRWLGFARFQKGRSPFLELIREAAVRRFIQERLKRPEEPTGKEFKVLWPHSLTLRIYWTPLEVEGEEQYLVRIENITQEKERNEKEAESYRIESLVRLAAGLAHEIGNPLNAIQIHLQLLKQEIAGLSKAKKNSLSHLVEILTTETRRLDQTVRTFLRTARRPPLRLRRDSLNEILEEVIRFLGPEIRKGKVKINLSLDKGIPEFLLDRDRLHQAFFNLIKNAVEAMPQGGKLAIATSLRDRLCLVRFQDEGLGINEGDLPHLFEAYYTTRKEGFGLGLTQVYQAVLEHGGRIDVKSQPGKGSTFTLILPIRQDCLSLPAPNREGAS